MSTEANRTCVSIDTAWSALRMEAGRGGAASERISFGADGWTAEGPIDDNAAHLLDALAPVAAGGRPIVIGQLGQSLDGRIATPTGHSHTINGFEALAHLHRLRALVDAVVVGAGTVDADRPRLTVRHVEGRDPVRVVLDPRGRADPGGSPLAAEADAPRTLHVVGRRGGLAQAGPHVERVVVPIGEAGVSPAEVLAALAARGLHRVLIEGGAFTLSRFIDASAIDRLHLLIAPMLMGSGRYGLELAPIDTVDQALTAPVRRTALGQDTLFDLDLRRAGGSGGS